MCYNIRIKSIRKDGIYLKKTLIALAAIFVCYIIDIRLGIAVTVAALAIFLVRKLPAIYALLGTRAYANNDTDKALRLYKKATTMGKSSGSIRNNYAMLLLRTGNPVAAQAEFDAVVCGKGYTAEEKLAAKQYRCMAYLKQGQTETAYSEVKELFADVKNTLTYGIIGYISQLVDVDDKELLDLCTEAYDYNSDDRDIVDNLVVASIRNNRLEYASELAATLRDKHPTFVEAFYHSALIEVKLGNKAKAREYLAHIPDCRRSYLTTVSEAEIESLAREAE